MIIRVTEYFADNRVLTDRTRIGVANVKRCLSDGADDVLSQVSSSSRANCALIILVR